MRELFLAMAMSLDGFVCGPHGEIEWIFSGDQEAIAWKLQNLSDISLHIMGRHTFQAMAGFWPFSAGVFAPAMNRVPKAVFSKRGQVVLSAAESVEGAQASGPQPNRLQPGAESWSRAYVAGGDLGQEIAELKSVGEKPIIAHGGAAFARSLVARNLVDQYMLMVYPIILGKGLPIFSEVVPSRNLKLVSSKVFPTGSAAQIYRRA